MVIAAQDITAISGIETIEIQNTTETAGVTLSDTIYTANGATALAVNASTMTTGVLTLAASTLSAANSVQLTMSATTNNAANVINLGSGNDTVTLDNIALDTGTIAGGAGTDTLVLSANTGSGSITAVATLTGFETVSFLTAGVAGAFKVVVNDANVAAGITQSINGSNLTGTLLWNGAAELDGNFSITGGIGADSLTGGSLADTISAGLGDDVITGGAGADVIAGGLGADTFVYTSGATTLGSNIIHSNSANTDSISDFVSGTDKLQVTLDYSMVASALDISATRSSAGVAGTSLAQDTLTGQRGQYVYDTTGSALFINFNNDNLLTASDFKIAINAASTATATVVEGDINFIITGGTAADTILAGGGADTINMGQGDSVNGGAGIDNFAFAEVTTASTITGGSGADIITLAAGTNSGVSIGDTDGFTLSGGTTNTVAITTALASTTFSLAATTTNTITFADTVASTTITGGTGVDTLTFTASKSNVVTITGGTGADVINLGATTTGITTLVFAAGDSTSAIGGANDTGTASVAFDAITNVTTGTTAANKDKIDVVGTASVAAAATVNGADSTLTIGGAVVGQHVISATGLTTFVVANGGNAQVVTTDASLAAVLQYLSGVDIGAAGQSLLFTATYGAATRGSVTHSFVYTQNSANAASGGAAGDGFTLIDFIGVTLVGLEIAASTTDLSLFIA